MQRSRSDGGLLDTGIVTAATVAITTSRLADGGTLACVLKGRSAQIAVGDAVEFARVTGGGVIESVAPRANLVYRSDAFREKLLAANVTQIVGVVAPDLTLDEELIHRWMIAAEALHCRFVLVANKADLPGFDALRTRLAPGCRPRLSGGRGQRAARRGADDAVAHQPAYGAGGPVGDGQVHADQRSRARGAGANDGSLRVAADGTPYHHVDHALPAARPAATTRGSSIRPA